MITDIKFNIKRHLLDNEVTQKEFAEKYEISTVALNRIVNNKTNSISKKMLIDLMNEFNIEDISDLFKVIRDDQNF